MSTITTLSSRDFNRDSSGAKKAADKGPVFITDRGKPAHVLLSIAQYQALAGQRKSLLQALAQSDADDIEFDPPRARGLFKAPDLG